MLTEILLLRKKIAGLFLGWNLSALSSKRLGHHLKHGDQAGCLISTDIGICPSRFGATHFQIT